MLDWIDEEFFKTGAFIEIQSGEILLAKGGEVHTVIRFPEELEEGVLYLKDFYGEKTKLYRPRQTVRVPKEQLSLLDHKKTSAIISSNQDHLYRKDFHKLMESFSADLSKVVLISRETYKASSPEKACRQLISSALGSDFGYPYGFWNMGEGITGSTPELLFDHKRSKLYTYALAGTSVRGKEDELLKSQKNLVEHDFVVKNIKEFLQGFSLLVTAGKTRTHHYGELIHLRTDIQAQLSPGVKIGEIVSDLSPTAALGGYPKNKALDFLKETKYHEKFSERIFGSAFGVTLGEETRFLVLIRNVQWKDDEFFIESGGGVVPSSNLEDELLEIARKRSLIRDQYFSL